MQVTFDKPKWSDEDFYWVAVVNQVEIWRAVRGNWEDDYDEELRRIIGLLIDLGHSIAWGHPSPL